MLPVIFLTAYSDVRMAVEAMKTGAVDFFEKPFREQILLDTIHIAIKKSVKMHRNLAAKAELQRRLARLSRRERDVLDLLITGRTSKAIALELGITAKTVDYHRFNVMQRMQVQNLIELARMVLGVREGDTPP